jgi:hypothetical protein
MGSINAMLSVADGLVKDRMPLESSMRVGVEIGAAFCAKAVVKTNCPKDQTKC